MGLRAKSTKTRIETEFVFWFTAFNWRLRAKSTKTRIETKGFAKPTLSLLRGFKSKIHQNKD